MALPPHQFHHQYNNHQQDQHANSFRSLYQVDGQSAPPVTYFNGADFADQSHEQYIPPFHVAGFAPGPAPVPATGGSSEARVDLQWNSGLEAPKKIPKEQDFLENNSQISSIDFLQARSVSTGLGLSLDNYSRVASSVDSPILSIIGDDIEQELQRQDSEIDRYLKLQGDRMRQAVLERIQANQLQTISFVEQRVLQKLREKEAEMESINKKNMELEEQMEQLTMEASAWQARAKYNENMITDLKFRLQQFYARNRDCNEGCGDSEVEDTASCCNGRVFDFHLLCKESSGMKELMVCKVCRVNKVSMLLLPCKHLCVCKECESKLSICPLCQCLKFIGMEVYM